MGNFKVYTAFNESLGQCRVSYLNKADNFTYYSRNDVHYSLNKMWFLLFSKYSGNNLPRPTCEKALTSTKAVYSVHYKKHKSNTFSPTTATRKLEHS